MTENGNQKNSSMFYCSVCKTDVNESDKFCPKCGADLSNEIEEKSNSEIIYCTKCGAKNKDGFNFCSSCGSPFPKTHSNDIKKEIVVDVLNQPPVKIQIEKNVSPYFELFIQESTAYYLSNWESIKSTKGKYTWNWSAALFGGFWFLYRKMYLTFFIACIIFCFVDLILLLIIEAQSFTFKITDIFGMSSWISGLIGIGVFGGFGNYFYLIHAKKKLSKILLESNDEQQLEKNILKKGGISPLSAWMPFIIIVVMIILAKLMNQGNN